MGDQIQRELAGIIVRELADPSVGPATLSGVDLSPDLRQAKVYVTPAHDSDGRRTVAGLNHAAAFLRRRLGTRIHLKVLPRLRFLYDPTLDEAHRIEALLDEVKGRAAGGAVSGDEDARRTNAPEAEARHGPAPGTSGRSPPGTPLTHPDRP